jgi:3-oxoacyl-[acyl-carrier protein] reductase
VNPGANSDVLSQIFRAARTKRSLQQIASTWAACSFGEQKGMCQMTVSIDLRGKRAWITGGSRGIGRAVAIKLAEAGAEVGVTFKTNARAASDFHEQAAALHPPSWARATDVSNPDDVAELLTFMRGHWCDGLDILVANAGVWTAEGAEASALPTEQWRRTVSVNLDGVFYSVRAALQLMRDDGRIVIVSSAAGLRGEPLHSDYAASKGALHAFAKAVCVEVARRGITVNCVAPGWCDTDMVAPVLSQQRNEIESTIPRRRLASVDDIAWPILCLCAAQSGHITGAVVPVTGGTAL